jgi:pilus assembly protein CpaF
MSLAARVRSQQVGEAPVAQAASTATLACLRSDIARFVTTEDIARLLASRPRLARSELLGACRQAFQLASWHDVPEERRRELTRELLDEVLGFGPLEALLDDPDITEVMVNGPANVFYEKHGKLMRSDRAFAGQDELRALIDRVLGPLGRRVDESSPMVNARLPEGHRVHVVMPPLAPDGPLVTIRKFTERVITLEEMVSLGSLDETMLTFLTWAVHARKNVVVSGGTGSGKTTLLNAMSCCIPEGERIVTIEDTAELRFLEHPHVVRLEARPRNAEGAGEVTIRDLVINALRMRPDRIVVGECRGAEAIDMLQAMLTGHDGSLTTLHANSPADVLSRLVTMVRYGVDLPVDVIEANAASAFDLVVQTTRDLGGSRYICEVAELTFDGRRRSCDARTLFKRNAPDDLGRWMALPDWIDDLPRSAGEDEGEVNAWKARLLAA